jgi:hypothetical protein
MSDNVTILQEQLRTAIGMLKSITQSGSTSSEVDDIVDSFEHRVLGLDTTIRLDKHAHATVAEALNVAKANIPGTPGIIQKAIDLMGNPR